MTKIAINREIGGFNLSHEATMRYAEIKGVVISAYKCDFENNRYLKYNPMDYELHSYRRTCADYLFSTEEIVERDDKTINDMYFSPYFLERDDPVLIQVIEEMGDMASEYNNGALKVVEIPDGVEWWIDEDDCGTEIIREKARCWY